MLFLGNGVTITVSGTHSIVKVSQADSTVSGETAASAYTMTQGTDYTMSYSPTGSNQGSADRTVTVTVTGIGKFSGQTKTVSYTQKADTACTTASTCTPSTSYTYSNYTVSYNGGAVACNAEPSKSNISVTANKTTTTKDTWCQESSTTENNVSITDFSVSYSPSGNNTGTSSRTVTGTVTHNGSTAGTFTFTQNSGSTCQATVTSTTYEYSMDAADFGECDTESSITIYATPTYYYSDGTNSTGSKAAISVLLSSTTYRLGTATTVTTASQNSTSSSRVWTVTTTFTHNGSSHTLSDTATQSAGPCNTGSTYYTYTFQNCYSDKQIGLFLNSTVPSGSHTQYVMLGIMDGLSVNNTVNSVSGMTVNGGTAYIGDTIKVYSVTNANVWTLEESITLSAKDRSFSYGDCSSTSDAYYLSFSNSSEVTTSSLTTSDSHFYVTYYSCYGTDYDDNNGTNVDCTYSAPGLTYADSTQYADCSTVADFIISGTSTSGTITITQATSSKTLTLNWSKTGSTEPTVTYSYSGTAENFDDCETSTSVKVYEKASTATNWTDITSAITPTLKYKTNNETSYSDSATKNSGSTSVVWSVQISFTRRSTAKTLVVSATQDAGPCSDLCTCSVTSISVSPSTYTYTSSAESKSFTVTITDNSSTCANCNGGFKVYDSNGLSVASGTTTFSLINTGGTYTIKANDDTSKTCTLTLTEYTEPTDVTGTTTEYDIVISGTTTIEACAEAFPSYGVYGINRTGVTHTNGTATSWGSWSSGTLLTSSQYTSTISPTAVTKNTSSSAKTYTITATGKTGTVYSGITSNTFTMTQEANCVTGGTNVNNLTINFPTEYGGRVAFTVTVNSVDITDTVAASTSLNYYKSGSVYEFVKPSASTSTGYNIVPLTFNTSDGDSVSVTCEGTGGYLDTYGGNFITATTQTSNIGSYTSSGDRNMSITIVGSDSCECEVLSVNGGIKDNSMIVDNYVESLTVTSGNSVTITGSVRTNDCSTCNGGFNVYNPNGRQMIKLSSETALTFNATIEGTYTIKAIDDTSKTKELTLSFLSGGTPSGTTSGGTIPVGISINFPTSLGGLVKGFNITVNGTNVNDSVTISNSSAYFYSTSTLYAKNAQNLLLTVDCKSGDTINVSFTSCGVFTSSLNDVHTEVSCECIGCNNEYCFSSSGIINNGDTTVDSSLSQSSISVSSTTS